MDLRVDSHSVIVFDLDDTLYNELDYLRSAYIEIAKKLNPESWELLFLKMFSLFRNKKNVFQILCEEYQVDLPELLRLYRNHNPRIKPFDGILDVMLNIKEKKGKIAVLTDGSTSTQNKKIEALGLKNHIDKVVTSEDVGTEKPSEQNFVAIENTFSKKNYVYIADNLKKDFITPNRLGWKTVCLVDNGKNIHKENYLYLNPEFLPNHYILSPRDINIV